ncbi:MAG: hypothetical protein HDS54_08660 [Barnesiella sp.]|nr:hypothetical protein [Barnesiella sp.]
MRTKPLFFLLMLAILCPASIKAADLVVSESDALGIARRQFHRQDVDYLIHRDSTSAYWTIFVDAEPMKGWKHDCYILTIPKLSPVPIALLYPSEIQKLDTPPTSYNLEPLLVKDRYGNHDESIPKVKALHPTLIDNEYAQKTYAVIISGGINKYSNHFRYWNDCSFIYQTLVNKYGIPKNHIYPIMSDGDNPNEDMEVWNYTTFISQPLDLDHDDENEIIQAATKENIRNTLEVLFSTMSKNDHLHIFVIDHGGRYKDNNSDNESRSTICLWEDENLDKSEWELKDVELAEMLAPICSKGINVNVVLGQCFSGGFIDDLTKIGCVVATASEADAGSWACKDIEYDEFVYHWICAVNEANHRGTKVKSDIDGNGRVTMEEAFLYAKINDREKESPQYISTPLYIGEDLAFNYIPHSVDIYVKDCEEDTGKEPNTVTDNFWISPSICVRNNPDKIFEHENPMYSSSHKNAYIYVRIYNRGRDEFDGNGKWIAAYWAEASTGITTKVWKGMEILANGLSTGGYVGSSQIGKIPPGGYIDVEIPWVLPDIMALEEGSSHYCLLVKIMDTPTDDLYENNKSYFDLKGSNNQAQKNLIIVKSKDLILNKEYNVLIRNTEEEATSYSLELIPCADTDVEFFERARLSMSMSKSISDAWEKGGSQYEEVEMPSINMDNTTLKTVNFVSPCGKLSNIVLPSTSSDYVKIRFDFTNKKGKQRNYMLDLIQRDSSGLIVGGERFIVDALIFSGELINPIIDVEPIPASGGAYSLSVKDNIFDTFQWLDGEDNIIGNIDNVVVTPDITNTKYSVIATDVEGEIGSASIDFSYLLGIESIKFIDDNVIVDFKSNDNEDSMLEFVSILDGETKLLYSLPKDMKTVSIETSRLDNGMYIVNYKIGMERIIDQKRIKIVR